MSSIVSTPCGRTSCARQTTLPCHLSNWLMRPVRARSWSVRTLINWSPGQNIRTVMLAINEETITSRLFTVLIGMLSVRQVVSIFRLWVNTLKTEDILWIFRNSMAIISISLKYVGLRLKVTWIHMYEHWEGVYVHSFSPIPSFDLSFFRPLCNSLIQHGDECSRPITREQYHPENQCNTRCGWLLRQWSNKPAKLAQEMEMVDCDSHGLSIGWAVSTQWVPYSFAVFPANNLPHRTVNYAPSSQ